MKIGIISDTHKKVKLAKDALDKLIADGAEFIIHAGDIVEVETLEMLRECGLRYVAVYGNNDSHLGQYHTQFNLVQEPYYFELADKKFKLMHLPFFLVPDADIVVFGHTHTFESELKNSTLYINSGEVCARSKPITEFVMLELLDDKYTVNHYTRKLDKKEFKTQKFKYKLV